MDDAGRADIVSKISAYLFDPEFHPLAKDEPALVGRENGEKERVVLQACRCLTAQPRLPQQVAHLPIFRWRTVSRNLLRFHHGSCRVFRFGSRQRPIVVVVVITKCWSSCPLRPEHSELIP